LFVRDGRALKRLTPAGEEVAARALRMLREAQALKSLAKDLKQSDRGSLSIGTTHTQARYVLPRVIRDFRQKYPDVQLHLHQGTSDQIAEMATLDRIDFAINTGSQDKFPDFVLLPIYSWHRQIIVPKDHPLAQIAKPTLQQLAEYPLVTYVFSFTGPSSLQQQFARAGLEPNVSLTARDADVIKTYVRLGLGVGVVASMAIEPEDEKDLAIVEAGHLFPSHVTWIGFRSGALLRGFTGFGFGLAAVPLLSLALPPAKVVPFVVVLQVIVGGGGLRHAWRHCDWRAVRDLYPGLVLGIPIGIAILTAFRPNPVRRNAWLVRIRPIERSANFVRGESTRKHAATSAPDHAIKC